MGYWEDRQAQALSKVSEKSAKAIEKQMVKYYQQTMERVIGDFEATYNKLLNTIEDGRQPTPADLYKLDKYWKLQAQAREELEKLGAKQIALLSKNFEANWFEVYYSINIDGATAFATIDKSMVQQMINQIWCADGKNWSSRIWANTNSLLETLNDGLVQVVTAGKKTTDLKNLLQERFGVSYSRADALVRTEIAHIQTQAAKKRYEDYGVEEIEIWADEDERRCEVCGKLHQKRYPIGANVPIPAHPRCRCSILPIIK
jgi:SPP1 gp7 family putative phage head morphogenesis protein